MDSGAEACLVRNGLVEELGLQCHQLRNVIPLTDFNGGDIRTLGTVYLEVHIGAAVVKHQFSVISDESMDTDVLIGSDLIEVAPMTLDYRRRRIIWADATYPMKLLKLRPIRRRVCRVVAHPSPDPNKIHMRVRKKKLTLPKQMAGHHAIEVDEEPGTVLYFESAVDECQPYIPLVLQVSKEKEIFLPFVNTTKAVRVLKGGTLLGEYYKIHEKVIEENDVACKKIKIHNDLMPKNPIDENICEGNREEKFQKIIEQQDWSHLSGDQQTELTEMLLKHHPVFIVEPNELGKFKDVQAHIVVSDPQPVRSPMYRYPEKAKAIISTMLEEMEEKDVIEPSTAAWLSPIVLVKKPDGSERMCLDYRKVNQHLQVDIHPLPRLEEMVESASGNRYYATLDMKEAYYQVELDEESRNLTTFSDGISLYRFKRLPFGLSCSPAVFSRIIGQVLAPLIKLGWVKSYLDDIVVYGPSYAALLKRLNELFTVLAKNGVKLNLKKCQFGQKEVHYLGHIISEEGCKPSPDNVRAVEAMKPPKNVKEVRRFLGMTGFYRKHVENYAKIAVPLTNLLKGKEHFRWTEECQQSFESLKVALTTAPVLAKAQITKQFELHTDASKDHIGAVLMQRDEAQNLRPIGYFSKKLKAVEQRYSTTDREALAVVMACRRFHHYLWGTSFTIHTDHQPLVSVFKRKTKSPRMNRWVVELQDYRFKIVYRPGRSNYVPDQLSRPVRRIVYEDEGDFLGLTKDEFRARQQDEPRWAELITYLEGGRLPKKRFPRALINQFMLHDELLYLSADNQDNSIQLKLVVPQDMRKEALKHGHVDVSGHLGRRKTIDALENMFYWPSLRSDVCKYVKECEPCQRYKESKGLQQKFHELPAVTKPLERISIDLTDMISGDNGYRYVLTVIDHYSRYVKYFKLRSKSTNEVSRNFVTYLNDFGVPQAVILDNGAEFTSTQFKDLCQIHKIKLGYITPYHPQGNSISERMHRTMKTVLKILCDGYPHQWPKYLGETQRVLNTAVHTTLGEQPHYVFFSRRAPRQISSTLPSFDEEISYPAIEKAHEVVQATHREMAKKFVDSANRKRRNETVEQGSLVWVKEETVIPNTSRKLNQKWRGPYRVLEVMRDGAKYKLESLFDQTVIERAAEKVKPYYRSEQWLIEEEEHTDSVVPDVVEVPTQTRPSRNVVPPRRLIEQM